jgi:hypothetical protein
MESAASRRGGRNPGAGRKLQPRPERAVEPLVGELCREVALLPGSPARAVFARAGVVWHAPIARPYFLAFSPPKSVGLDFGRPYGAGLAERGTCPRVPSRQAGTPPWAIFGPSLREEKARRGNMETSVAGLKPGASTLAGDHRDCASPGSRKRWAGSWYKGSHRVPARLCPQEPRAGRREDLFSATPGKTRDQPSAAGSGQAKCWPWRGESPHRRSAGVCDSFATASLLVLGPFREPLSFRAELGTRPAASWGSVNAPPVSAFPLCPLR